MSEFAPKSEFESVPETIVAPVLDYRRHPAFSAFASISAKTDSIVSACVAEIDAAFNDSEALGDSLDADTLTGYDARVAPAQARLLSALVADQAIAEDTQNWLAQSIAESLRMLREELQILARQQRSIAQHRLAEDKTARIFIDRGITDIALPPGTSAQWLQQSEILRQGMRAHATAKPALRQHAAIPEYSSLGRSIVRQLHRCGAWAMAEQLQGCSLEIAFMDLHYSHPKQSWYKHCYTDVGLETSSHSYLHYDYLADSQKLLLYFAPVAPENGPFCFIPGSTTWQRSAFSHVMSKVLDKVHMALFEPSCADGYYRARFRGELERRRFAGLPSAFQVTSHFGDDVIDGSAASKLLDQHEQSYTEIDRVVLFNGNRGIHRGGLCTAGERWAVHLGLHETPQRSAWKLLRNRLGKVRAALR